MCATLHKGYAAILYNQHTMNNINLCQLLPSLQMFGMVVPYEYITGIPMDMLTNLVVSSLVKQLPFALHVPLSLLECGTVAYVLASQSGMCGATDALTHAIPCPVVDPVASVDTARCVLVMG